MCYDAFMTSDQIYAEQEKIEAALMAADDLRKAIEIEAGPDGLCRPANRQTWTIVAINAEQCAIDCGLLAETIAKCQGKNISIDEQAIGLYAKWMAKLHVHVIREMMRMSAGRAASVSARLVQRMRPDEQEEFIAAMSRHL